MKKSIALLLSVATIFLCACEEIEGKQTPIKLDKSELTFPSAGGEQTVTAVNYNSWWISGGYEDFDQAKNEYTNYYTFYRPRDLILLCNHIGEYAYYFPIKGKTVKQLIHKYTIDNVKEIKDELAIYHSYSQDIVAKIFALLKALTSYQYSGFSKEAINTKLQECGLGREILSLLIEYSLIIPYDAQTGKYYIKYRETNIDDFVIEDGSIQYKLHNSIYAYYVPDSIKLIE